MHSRKRQRISGLANTLRRLQSNNTGVADASSNNNNNNNNHNGSRSDNSSNNNNCSSGHDSSSSSSNDHDNTVVTTNTTTTTTSQEVVVLVGIACAVKTAFARQRFPRHTRVARQHLRVRRTDKSLDAKLTAVLARHLADGRSVVLDAAHASHAARLAALASVRDAAATAAVRVRTVAYVFHLDPPRFVARARRRAAFDAASASRHLAPDAAIEREARAFQWPATSESGFDELFYVSALDNDDDDDGEPSDSCDFRFDVQPYLGGRLHAPPL